MFSCESRVTLTVSGRTRAVQETKFTLGQDLRLAKQSRKHFVVSKSNGRNWALSTSCSGSFETDLFTLSLKHLTWTDRHVHSFYSCSYNSCILVFRIDFRLCIFETLCNSFCHRRLQSGFITTICFRASLSHHENPRLKWFRLPRGLLKCLVRNRSIGFHVCKIKERLPSGEDAKHPCKVTSQTGTA